MSNNDNWREKMEKLLEEHSKRLEEIEKRQMKDKFDLSNLITEAVQKAVDPLIQKMEKQNDRLIVLENADAQKALKNSQNFWKTVTTVAITGIVTGVGAILLNNFIAMISNNVGYNVNSNIETREVQNEKTK